MHSFHLSPPRDYSLAMGRRRVNVDGCVSVLSTVPAISWPLRFLLNDCL